ncbi:MAG: hypothetical protein HQK49_10975 [Oligoflexia bacterium]|nr:hypothetical protein [Oligoflexia bacterium]
MSTTVNDDLQATHSILALLEISKSHSELTIDNLPIILTVVNERYEILRGNKLLSILFKKKHEKLLREKFSTLFKKEIWSIFENNFNKLKENKELKFVEFELPLISKEGIIRINCLEEQGKLIVTVEDDGKGIDLEKILDKIIKNKYMPLEKDIRASEDELTKYIFEAGFSTAQQLTEVSGRGVGLDVVKQSLEKIGGTIVLKTFPKKGTKFTISISTETHEELERTLVSLNAFLFSFGKELSLLENKENLKIKLNAIYDYLKVKNGIIFIDQPKMILALTTYIGLACKKYGLTNCYFENLPRGILRLTIEHKENINTNAMKDVLQFQMSLNRCKDYILAHGGSVVEQKGSITITFGHLLNCNQLPSLSYSIQFSTDDVEKEEFEEKIEKIKDELDMDLYEKMDGNDSQIIFTDKTDKVTSVLKTIIMPKKLSSISIRDSILKYLQNIIVCDGNEKRGDM